MPKPESWETIIGSLSQQKIDDDKIQTCIEGINETHCQARYTETNYTDQNPYSDLESGSLVVATPVSNDTAAGSPFYKERPAFAVKQEPEPNPSTLVSIHRFLISFLAKKT